MANAVQCLRAAGDSFAAETSAPQDLSTTDYVTLEMFVKNDSFGQNEMIFTARLDAAPNEIRFRLRPLPLPPL